VDNADTDNAVAAQVDMSVVVVCWNNRAYLQGCLRSLFDAGPRSRFDVVLVDNGSTDGTQAMIRSAFPQVRLIENASNMGLSRAANQGISASAGRHVLLLNDDTEVNGPSLDAMAACMDAHPDAGAVGGRLLNPDGSLQTSFSYFSSLWQEFLIATTLGRRVSPIYPNHGKSAAVTSVDWINSACLLLRRAALETVGLLDEEYFIYGDETDLQYRLKQAGWRVYFVPDASTVHYGGRSLDRWRRRRMVYRGKLLFFRKNYGPVRTAAFRAMLAFLSAGKLVVWALALVAPGQRDRARRELASGLDVIRLCWRLS
jgi:N-acetylglucosaminyl-diphospho-decaprenol L-rhamnosyltransferase